MSYYRIDELPCIKEKQEQHKATNNKMLFWGFILSSLLPSVVMFVFHDYLFPYAWNPVDFFISIMPLIWGIPLYACWKETKVREKT